MSFDRKRITTDLLDRAIAKLWIDIDDSELALREADYSQEFYAHLMAYAEQSELDPRKLKGAILMGIDIGLKLADEMVQLDKEEAAKRG